MQSLGGTGVVRRIALNPGTPVEAVKPLLDELDLVVLLAVDPGWGGRSFIPSTDGRIGEVRTLPARRPKEKRNRPVERRLCPPNCLPGLTPDVIVFSFASKEQSGQSAAVRPLRKPRGQSARCSLPHESTSAVRLLAGTNEAIGKRLRAAPSAPDAVPEFMPKRKLRPIGNNGRSAN